jgi:hypothetical protein
VQTEVLNGVAEGDVFTGTVEEIPTREEWRQRFVTGLTLDLVTRSPRSNDNQLCATETSRANAVRLRQHTSTMPTVVKDLKTGEVDDLRTSLDAARAPVAEAFTWPSRCAGHNPSGLALRTRRTIAGEPVSDGRLFALSRKERPPSASRSKVPTQLVRSGHDVIQKSAVHWRCPARESARARGCSYGFGDW